MSSVEMRSVLKNAEDLRFTIEAQLGTAHLLSQADPPAQEPVSVQAVTGQNGVNDTGRYYEGHLHYQLNYLSELIGRLRQALGIVETTDQQAAEGTTKTYGTLG
ncbi:hypothetical protein ACIOD2_36670 [Amycolatopsis sp. NPDC088138]|uniref:hypothetical protein n=1 Tax=Amycolatopsis sp. NPDC088138 TaxID=3363938 RepID=UPI0038147AA9